MPPKAQNYLSMGVALAFAVLSLSALADTTTWTGASDNDWFTTANWSNGAPDNTLDAFIDGGPKTAIDSRWARAGSLTLGTASTDSGTLIVDGTAGPFSGGALSIGPCSGCDGTSLGGSLAVGLEGAGDLTITNGGLVYSQGVAYIVPLAGSVGTVTLDGSGSTWDLSNDGRLLIGATNSGDGGTALLNVSNGAAVVITNSFAGLSSVLVGMSGTIIGDGSITVNSVGLNPNPRMFVNGTLAPRGTLTLGATLALNSSATTDCTVSPGAADRVDVSAVVYLGGRLSVTMEGTFTDATTRYTLLYAGGGRHITAPQFTSVSIKYPTNQHFTPHITYEGNYVYLDLEFAPIQ